MRKIILHVGFGKTGSSALQVWLANVRAELKTFGIHYPFFGGKLKDYAITAGNGVELLNALRAEKCDKILDRDCSGHEDDVLYSSEMFQLLEPRHADALREYALNHSCRVVCFAYIRDVYDMVYSTYVQLVKRHCYTKSFFEFATSGYALFQLNVLPMFVDKFPDFKLLHYDSEAKIGLEKSFCRVIKLDQCKVPPMANTCVNRSLSLEELKLMLMLNHYALRIYPEKEAQIFSSIVSDRLISQSVERKTEILFDKNVHDHLIDVASSVVAEVNRKHFKGDVLAIFNPTGKHVVTEDACIMNPVTADFMSAVFDALAHMHMKGTSQVLSAKDPKIVDFLRSQAIHREEKSLGESLILMQAAQIFRPNGPVINSKIAEYKSRLATK